MKNADDRKPKLYYCDLGSKPDEYGSIVPVLVEAVNGAREGRTAEILAIKSGPVSELDAHRLQQFLDEISKSLGVQCSSKTVRTGHYLVTVSPK